LATNVEVVMKVKIPLLIFSGIGIKSSTNATICGERARSEYVVERGGCVAGADLCGEQEKREGIAEGVGASGVGFQVDPSPGDALDCHFLSLKVVVESNCMTFRTLLCCRALVFHLSPNVLRGLYQAYW
jgi:hypothetical protein